MHPAKPGVFYQNGGTFPEKGKSEQDFPFSGAAPSARFDPLRSNAKGDSHPLSRSPHADLKAGSDLDCLGAPRRSMLCIACPDFFQKSERAHAATPSLQIESALLGSDLFALTESASSVSPLIPSRYNPNLFPIGDGFGLLLFFGRYEATFFRNGARRKSISKPSGLREISYLP